MFVPQILGPINTEKHVVGAFSHWRRSNFVPYSLVLCLQITLRTPRESKFLRLGLRAGKSNLPDSDSERTKETATDSDSERKEERPDSASGQCTTDSDSERREELPDSVSEQCKRLVS